MDANVPDRDHENEIGHDLTALEHRLAAWRPAAGALDRDRMLYDAGRASTGARTWRLATAALLLATMGLGGLLAHERTQLVRERTLVARERARRVEVEMALATHAQASEPTPAVPAATPAIEPPAPDSYRVLTARLAEEIAEAPWPVGDGAPAPTGPATRSSEPSPRPVPIRPIDIERILEL